MSDTSAPAGVYNNQHQMPGNVPTRPMGKGTLQNSVNGFPGPPTNNVPAHFSGGQRLSSPVVGPTSAHPQNRFPSDSPNTRGLLNGPGGNPGPTSSLPNRPGPPPTFGTSSHSYQQTGVSAGPPRPGFPSNPVPTAQTSHNVSGPMTRPPLGGATGMHPPMMNTSPVVESPHGMVPGGFDPRQTGGPPTQSTGVPPIQVGGPPTQVGVGPSGLAGSRPLISVSGSSTTPGQPTGEAQS